MENCGIYHVHLHNRINRPYLCIQGQQKMKEVKVGLSVCARTKNTPAWHCCGILDFKQSIGTGVNGERETEREALYVLSLFDKITFIYY